MPTTAQRFSLRTALSESLRYAIPGIGHLLKILWPVLLALVPAIVIVGFIFVNVLTPEKLAQDEASAEKLLFNLVILVLGLIFGSALITVIGRDYILAESPVRMFPVYWSVLLRTFLFTLIMLVIMFIIVMGIGFLLEYVLAGAPLELGPGFVVNILILIGILYLYSRLVTWVVSRAIDRPQTFRETWRATGGAIGWKIAAGFIIITLLAMILLFVIYYSWRLIFPALNQIPEVLAYPAAILFFLTFFAVYLIAAAVLTAVYPATIFSQMARPK